MKSEKFIFGIHIYRFPSLPLQELKKDMRILKKLGFNTVKVQESWAIDERREGEVDLSDVEELVAEARQLGLGVYLGVTMELAPMWLWRKYPDCHMVNALGEPHRDPTQYLLPSDGKPGPCWDHPGVREAEERFLTKLVRTLGRYENIVVWSPQQEIDITGEDRPGATTLAQRTYCYCPYTLSHFREWLKGRYGSLDALNSAWRTGFGEWEEVEPPRTFMMVPSWIDWRYFMEDVYLPGKIRWRAEVFRKNDPLRRPVIVHGGGDIGSGRGWELAKCGEILGTSFYPTGRRPGEWDWAFREKPLRYELADNSLKFDNLRSSAGGRELWLSEFQGGRGGGLVFGPEVRPEDIRRWLMTALSAGVGGVCFWNHRPEIFWREMHGFGLCGWDGSPTKRAEEAGRIAKALSRHPELFRYGKVPRAQVAIVTSEDLYHFAEASSDTGPYAEARPDALRHLQHTIKGWHRCLWEEGIWVDFVEEKEVLEGGLKSYRVAILPFPVALGDELAEALREYVAAGGTLISEACPGRVDRYGMARLSGMADALMDLFGAEHESLSLCGEWGGQMWSPPRERYEVLPPTELAGDGPYSGHALRASFYVETYRVRGGRPILRCDRGVAGVSNDHGRGRGFLLGTLAGHAVATYDHAQSRAFMLKLVKEAGVLPERCGRLLRRRRVWKDQEAWFLINPLDREVEERVEVEGFRRVEDLLEGKSLPIEGKAVPIALRAFGICCLVLRR